MTKTIRKPYKGNCAISDKRSKTRYHKKSRGIQNTLIRKGRLEDVPWNERLREYEGGDWTFSKDGKHYDKSYGID